MKVSENGVCSICDEVFKESELLELDDLFLCSSDQSIYRSHKWIAHKQTTVSNSNMNDALILQELKDNLKTKNQPSFILSHYDDKNGEIQTVSTLYIPSQKTS